MNLFDILFYSKYVNPALYPIPIKWWVFWNEALTTFPTIDTPFPSITQSSRRTKKIQLIILHHSGSLDANKAIKWYSNPNTYASTHYLINLDGDIIQLVPDEKASLHTPNAKYKNSRLVNENSLGISLVGDGFQQFTEAQYEAVAMLCTALQKKYNLKNEDIYKHSEIECIPAATDPLPWNKEKFLKLLNQFSTI